MSGAIQTGNSNEGFYMAVMQTGFYILPLANETAKSRDDVTM